MDSAYLAVYPDLYRNHWWWRVREHILLMQLRSLLKGKAGAARILDVGCGAGLFFDALKGFGYVEGIESDAAAVEHSGPWRHRILAGELNASFRAARPYDVILMLDLLEHVQDPEELLGFAGALLEPNGRVLITVPAFESLWTAHDDINHHLRRYTAGELRRTITSAGLIVEQCTYLFQSLVLPKLFVRGSEAAGLRRPNLPKVPAAVLNNALQVWFRAEYAVARWLPFGSSLMAVARRAGPIAAG
jgi:2-polyprenyl-3-methyl-5-hydroxy-6-metoxy-1,4-benzoquinol methylase